MNGRILAIGAVVLVLIGGILAFTVFRTPEEASAPIEAIPIDATATPAEAAAAPTEAPEATATEAPTATAAPEASPTAEATAEPTAAPTAEVAGEPITFEIQQAASQARFLIDEVLRGEPITVVGATDQVAGQLAVDPADPTAAQIGIIQINARTLATDNEFRDRAIKNRILQTDQFEFVTFTPTEISGLPESAEIGESYSFQVSGDLTVRDVTRPATFDVTVTPVSAERIEGLASTTLAYADYGLSIPDVPAVDLVADELTLELEFVAEPLS